ncbi:MAG: BON domain-containing protein [Pirellulaceae bacterium]
MRRFHVGLAILAFALLAPTGALADDRQIAKEIVDKLQEKKQEGELKNFSIDLQVKDGAVHLKGYVTRPEHQAAAIDIARRVKGVERVYNDLEVKDSPAAEHTARHMRTHMPTRGAKNMLAKLNSVLVGAGRKASFTRQASHSSRSRLAARDDSKQIAHDIVNQMREEMERGNLRGFGVDVEVDKDVVWLKGRVSTEEQRELALDIARHTQGVGKVVNELTVKNPSRPQPLAVEARADVQPEKTSDKIAEEVIRQLKQQQRNGLLKNFGVDVSVNEGVVWLSGRVASKQQQRLVLDQARYVRGVKQVVNDITIDAATPVVQPIAVAALTEVETPSATSQQAPALLAPAAEPAAKTALAAPAVPAVAAPAAPVAQAVQAAPVAQAVPFGYVPIQYVAMGPPRRGQVPVPFAPARPVSHNVQAQMMSPVPMSGAGVGIAPARFDHPQLPGYAWPSYAPYPNYGAVTYPKQYSPAAWPYIGPFYPYPQVPLGWRKVTLEWDDGWWQLDFKSR